MAHNSHMNNGSTALPASRSHSRLGRCRTHENCLLLGSSDFSLSLNIDCFVQKITTYRYGWERDRTAEMDRDTTGMHYCLDFAWIYYASGWNALTTGLSIESNALWRTAKPRRGHNCISSELCRKWPAPLKPRQHGALQILYCIVLYCIVFKVVRAFRFFPQNATATTKL